MNKFDTLVQELKYKVLKEVALNYYNGTLDENIHDIPKVISPGPKATMRCCVYRERAIVEDRIKQKKEKGTPSEAKEEKKHILTIPNILVQGVATSIDALALGFVYLSYTITNAMIVFSVIGIVTFLLSLLTIFLGKKIGGWLENWSGLIAGVVFIAIGLKILLESILSFSTSPAIDFQSISYIFTILR